MSKQTKNKRIQELITDSMSKARVDEENLIILSSVENKNRFKITMSFNQDIVNLIKTFDGRSYDASDHSWTLPNQYYENFICKVKDMDNITLKPLSSTKKLKPETFTAEITKNMTDETITISMPYKKNAIDGLKRYNNKYYNPETQEWTLDMSDLEKIEKLLMDNEYTIKHK
jgi:hypothetical protein